MPDFHLILRRLARENQALRAELERTRTELAVEKVYAEVFLREARGARAGSDDETSAEK